ncbi:MAG: ATP-dependent DNA helicase RecQ [Bdellovibrionota bacterium]
MMTQMELIGLDQRSSVDLQQLRTLLQKHYGFADFRKGQIGILESILSGQDTLAVMPTGGGKSLCYQIPALLPQGGIVVVVSPLIALMRDQVQNLKSLGIPAGALHSGQDLGEKRDVFSQLNNAHRFILYVSPERVQNDGFAPWLQKQKNIRLFAIDEAHCISQWGSDFRQDYYKLKLLKDLRPDVPILALTATATPPVLDDISRQLKLRSPAKHVYGFYRPNLFYQVETCEKEDLKAEWVKAALRQFPQGRVIIYCGTRKKTVELATALKGEFKGVDYYHAGRSSDMRSKIQTKFENGKTRILVATNAFGMGIDHPDVRLLIHLQMPANIESLYQEMGRAGRDGAESTCLLLYSKKDKGLQAYFIQSSDAPDEILQSKWRALDTITQFVEVFECRHAGVLSYFRDPARMKACGHCDVCAPDSLRKVQEPSRDANESTLPSFKRRSKTKARAIVKSKAHTAQLSESEERAYELIKDWRRDFAAKNDQPAFMVFSNKALEDLVRKDPRSLDELLDVKGFGPHKIEIMGEELLSQLTKARELS